MSASEQFAENAKSSAYLSKVDWEKPTPAEHAGGAYDPDCSDCRAYAQAAPSDDIAKRMEALVRKVADASPYSVLGDSSYASEARAIVALLPEPVDADLVEAREVCAEASIRAGQPQQAEEYRAGKWDAGYTINVAKIALRRALERDSREG